MDPEVALFKRLAIRLRVRHFLLLSEIARHKSLRKVAGEFNLSQPAITKMLQELEGIIGSQLFDRGASGLTPTRVGSLLVDRSSAYLQDINRLAMDLIAMEHGYRGTIRIGITSYIPQGRLSEAIELLGKTGYSFTFALIDGSTDTLIALLRKREIDCMIGRLTSEHSEDLIQEVLYEQTPVLTISRKFSPRAARQLNWESLSSFAWVLPPATTPMRKAFETMLARRQIVLPRAIIETTSPAVLAETMRRNDRAVCLAPDELAAKMEADGVARILQLPLDFSLPPVTLIRRRNMEGDKVLEMFRRAILAGEAPKSLSKPPRTRKGASSKAKS